MVALGTASAFENVTTARVAGLSSVALMKGSRKRIIVQAPLLAQLSSRFTSVIPAKWRSTANYALQLRRARLGIRPASPALQIQNRVRQIKCRALQSFFAPQLAAAFEQTVI